jgi:hypothetical protein
MGKEELGSKCLDVCVPRFQPASAPWPRLGFLRETASMAKRKRWVPPKPVDNPNENGDSLLPQVLISVS